MPGYRLTIAYDGTDFHGWQKQEPPDAPPLRTVQAVVEHAIRTVVREPILLSGASRTDSGVHAEGQAGFFRSTLDLPPERMIRAINSRLPDDVLIRAIRPEREDFDPIAEAIEKHYRYRLVHGIARGTHRPLFDRNFRAAIAYPLEIDRMQRAAQDIVGTHDFASFTRLHHGREHTVRTVTACTVTPSPATEPGHLDIDVCGTGFLYNMVRIIAGTLIEIGRGARDPLTIGQTLEARDRRAAGPTAPPEGLCLLSIRYAGDPAFNIDKPNQRFHEPA